jgi:hypothetical protein
VSVNFACFERLDEVARDAAEALDRAARPSLYDRLDWFRLLETHCPPSGKLLVVRAEAGTDPSWLFLAVEGKAARPYAAWYSLRVGPIGPCGRDAMTSFADALTARGLASLVMAPMEDPAPLAGALRAAGWWVRVEPDKANWRIATESMDFDSYWASRSGKLRNTVKRKTKAAGLDVTVHRRFDAAAWADYEAVYRASWKPEEGSFPFLRALAEQEGAAGALRLGIAGKDGRPLAAQLWTVENGAATIHKLAYAEDAKALSPGSILSHAMFRHALDEDHVALIDYGLGDEPYKAEWMDTRRRLWRLAAHNPRTPGGLLGGMRAGASALAARLRNR